MPEWLEWQACVSNNKNLTASTIHIQVEFLIPCFPLSVRVDWYKLLDPDLYAVRKVKVVESFIGFVSHTIHSKFPRLPLESKSRQEKRWSARELMGREGTIQPFFCQFTVHIPNCHLCKNKNCTDEKQPSFCSGYFADISGRDLDGCSDTNVAISSPWEVAARAA